MPPMFSDRGDDGSREKPKLDLAAITICAADSVNPDLAARALRLSLRECAFGEAILFSDRPTEGPFRFEPIAPLASSADYSRFVLRDLHRYIATPFVLIVQWDGYVLHPGSWTPDFLGWDYIGATWPWHPDRKVGNGGFSLRSRRLLDVVASMPDDLPAGLNEDFAICKHWRAALESEHAIKFAPEAIADRFSYERALPEAPTFGFHGLFNMWRHLGDDELMSVAVALSPDAVASTDYFECMLTCFFQRRFGPLAAFYAPLRSRRSTQQIREIVSRFERDPATVDSFFRVAETALQAFPGLLSAAASGR